MSHKTRSWSDVRFPPIILALMLSSCGSVDNKGRWRSPYGFIDLHTVVRIDGVPRFYDITVAGRGFKAVSSREGELEDSSWNRMLVRRGWMTPKTRKIHAEYWGSPLSSWSYNEMREGCRRFRVLAVAADVKHLEHNHVTGRAPPRAVRGMLIYKAKCTLRMSRPS